MAVEDFYEALRLIEQFDGTKEVPAERTNPEVIAGLLFDLIDEEKRVNELLSVTKTMARNMLENQMKALGMEKIDKKEWYATWTNPATPMELDKQAWSDELETNFDLNVAIRLADTYEEIVADWKRRFMNVGEAPAPKFVASRKAGAKGGK